MRLLWLIGSMVVALGVGVLTLQTPRPLGLDAPATAFSTASASDASSVIRIDCAAVSCSACARRSAAIQSGLQCLSARISTSEGPAIMSMPTVPNTSRFAAAT